MQNKKKRLIGSFEIFNLIFAVMAFAFLIGLQIGVVSAQNGAGTHIEGGVTTPGTGETGAGAGGTGAGAEKTSKLGIKELLFRDPGAELPPGVKPEGIAGFLKNNPGWTGLIQGAAWAGIAWTIVPFIGEWIGLREETINALKYSVSAGLFTAGTIRGLAAKEGVLGLGKGGALSFIGANPFISGAVVGVVVFLLTYEKEKFELVRFECNPWEAPVGGADCEKCNEDSMKPCSEYRCKSLGQACNIVNKGTDAEKCVWTNPKDVTSPMITPWEEALIPDEGYRYTNTQPRPPGWGTVIQGPADGCIEAFSPIQFGILTNKPAQCKIDFKLTENYDEMQYYLGGSNLYSYNFTQKLNLPGQQAIESFAEANADEETGSLIIENAKDYNWYIRCKSANGYYNPDPYLIRFCVDDGPDLTAPKIEEMSIKNNQPVNFEVDEVPITVYTNEPANCRWSRNDQSFENMENSMTCVQSIADMEDNLFYPCTGTLTGVEDRKENKYYFRCEDKPWATEGERIRMQQSESLTLIGTEPLNTKEGSVKPITGSIVSGATTTVEVNLEVQTQNGYKEGEAECYYSQDIDTLGPLMAETNIEARPIHKQRQDLQEGNYKYYFTCIDLGGNTARANTNFSVFVDTQEPQVVRILYDNIDRALKIITDEDAICRYNIDSQIRCDFDIEKLEGNPMQPISSSDRKTHMAAWDTKQTYYIRCVDDNGKQPDPTQCSIIVKPVES